jgi:putative transposase
MHCVSPIKGFSPRKPRPTPQAGFPPGGSGGSVPRLQPPALAPTSIDYDARILAFQEWNWTIGLTHLSGRVKIATCLGVRQKTLLKGRKPTSATLVKQRDGGYFLHVPSTDESPGPIEPVDFIGVDMGVKNPATTDDGENHSGEGVDRVRTKYGRIRRTCQETGTKSARRKHHKTRLKEAAYRRNQNHVISKRIVAKAKATNSAIACEDLAGIGERTTARKPERNRMKGWAFHHLRRSISYKATLAGIPVIPVDPRNTPRTCTECGHCERSVC